MPSATNAGPLDELNAQIRAAWAELQEARADCKHSLNCDTLRTEDYAELRVNRLLDRLAVNMTPEQMAAALARPVKQEVDA